jgi:hypothetical protein
LTVTNATLTFIQVTPIEPSIAEGTLTRFIATGIYSDGTNQNITRDVTWASSDRSVARIGNAALINGRAIGLNPGSTTITATLNGLSSSTLLVVTNAVLIAIQVTPIEPSIAEGTFIQFRATGIYSDITSQDLTEAVTWTSSNQAVAQISDAADSKGQAKGLDIGSTTITATLNDKSGSTLLTVTDAILTSIHVTPIEPSIAKGTSIQFTAIGIYSDETSQDLTEAVTWTSSDETVAQISDAADSKGEAKGLNIGSTTIAATLDGLSGSTLLTVTSATLTSIQVTPIEPSIARGTSIQFTATGIYTDLSTQDLTKAVTWTSSSQAVAQISDAADSKGQAKGLNIGSTTITATLGGLSSSTLLTVTSATLTSIQVTPINPSIAKGTSIQFRATGIYTDLSTQDLTKAATWTSSNQAVAQISDAADSKGQAKGLNIGSTTITATLGGLSSSTLLTVTSAALTSIQVTPVDPSIAKGTLIQFTAVGIYSDGTNQDITEAVTWTSSNQVVAQISDAADSKGEAMGLNIGSTTITAALNGLSDSTVLTVTSATLTSIQVTPINPSIARGTSIQFTATGIYTDLSTQDLTKAVTWTSSNQTVAQISDAADSKGEAKGLNIGSTTITATLGGLSCSTLLTVTSATLSSIQVTPINPSITNGTSIQFTAIGTYTDLSTQDLTNAVTWTSSNQAVAQISDAANSKGQATGVNIGITTITATLNGVSGTTLLTVAVLDSIAITPSGSTINVDGNLQFTAIGTLNNGSTQDLTQNVTWTSSNTTVAQISNAVGSKGLATGKTVGQTTIMAQYLGVSASTTLTVVCPSITLVQYTPFNSCIGATFSYQFKTSGVLPAVLFEITAGSLPPGVTLNSSTGVLSGTPTGPEPLPQGKKYNFTIRATNKCGNSDSKDTSITIFPSNHC